MESKNKFYVLVWDINKDKIEHYDILPYFRKEYETRFTTNSKYKELKAPKTLLEFKDFIEHESLYQYWSRCEYEMIIHGWPVEKECYKIDVHEQIMMNLDIIANILYNEYFGTVVDKEKE